MTARLAHLTEDEPDRQVEVLRQFQRAAIFRVAMADLTGKIPLMRVSDYLTEIAEIIVGEAMRLAWAQMTAQFGVPQTNSRDGPGRRAVNICAVGYGKLGGNELGYASDLDLVFLHDAGSEHSETDAAKPVDNQVFFIRFAQRVLHLLTMHSAAGRLYEVDVRLRPSGKGGMLITRVGAFAEYQEKEAWTWEHQALLHARAVAGDAALRAEFERVRVDVLTRCVRRDTLRTEVRNMRERMRKELSKAQAGSGKFDIKQDAGGTADIEFLAQYWALLHAGTHPPVVMFADTIRQLESVASADLVPAGNRRHADACLSKVSGARPSPVARAGGSCRPGGRIRGRPRRGERHLERDDGRQVAIAARRCLYNPPPMPATKPLIQPNAQNEYKVDASDLPLACPMPEMYLWNSHPRVYLPIEQTGWAKCPYCGAEYPLTK